MERCQSIRSRVYPGPYISHGFSLSLFSLSPSALLSFSLAGATCAPRNSSFISRVLCSAAAVRPKKFLSRPSARLLSIPPFPLSRLPPSRPSNVNLNQISLISRVPSDACKNSRARRRNVCACAKYFYAGCPTANRRYLNNAFIQQFAIYIKFTYNKNSLIARKKELINN